MNISNVTSAPANRPSIAASAVSSSPAPSPAVSPSPSSPDDSTQVSTEARQSPGPSPVNFEAAFGSATDSDIQKQESAAVKDLHAGNSSATDFRVINQQLHDRGILPNLSIVG